ncbi:MAG: hypothetical protein ACJ8JD_00195 [Chthoniobacterales bacterium]
MPKRDRSDGNQGERVREKAEHNLRDDECEVECGADREGRAKILRRMLSAIVMAAHV